MTRVLFDTRWIGEHGIGRFANEIYKGADLFDKIDISGNPASKFDFINLSFHLFRKKTLFFTPGYNSPLFGLSKCVITIHDLNHVDIGYNSSILKKIYYSLILKRACKKCAKIFTVSDFSKRRIVDWSGVSAKKVVVVGNGISQDFHMNVMPHIESKPYILMVSNRKLHKNEERAIRAYSNSSAINTCKLLITGFIDEKLNGLLKELNILDNVVFLGRLSDQKLASIYKGSLFLLFPSLYEGFGLPVIEAMACGTPVLTSNSTSLGEIAGNAALLVDPTNMNEITSAIEQLIDDEILRKDLIQKGLERAKCYSWGHTVSLVRNQILEINNAR